MKNKKTNIILYSLLSIILVVGIVLFIVAGYIQGWDFKAWFTSNMAIWCYFLVGIYIIVVIIVWLYSKYEKM